MPQNMSEYYQLVQQYNPENIDTMKKFYHLHQHYQKAMHQNQDFENSFQNYININYIEFAGELKHARWSFYNLIEYFKNHPNAQNMHLSTKNQNIENQLIAQAFRLHQCLPRQIQKQDQKLYNWIQKQLNQPFNWYKTFDLIGIQPKTPLITIDTNMKKLKHLKKISNDPALKDAYTNVIKYYQIIQHLQHQINQWYRKMSSKSSNLETLIKNKFYI